MMKRLILSALLFVSAIISRAQSGFSDTATSCGTTGIMKHFLTKNAAANNLNSGIEQQILYFKKSGQRLLSPQAVVTLPVVVHIIHNNGPENISDTRVLTAIQHLNEAFANTGYYNPATGVNTNIQFCLAQRDPGGNLTNGITRNVSSYTNMGGPYYYSDDLNVKNVNRWNPSCYINIWLVNDIPGAVAGYAYMPAAHGNTVDGIVLEAAYFGSSYRNDVVIIHETGHYLGLLHTFEGGCANTDCLADGDKVCDTPPDNSTAYTSCGVPVNSCSTDIQSGFSSDQNDLTEDYMDYGNLDCMNVFTQGQADRMNWFITNVRSSLLNCKSCLPPCPTPVVADFNSSATNISAGTTVNFTNTSNNGVTYSWYINNVLQSTAINFSNTFNTAGIFIIKLVVAGNNSTLCDSSEMEETITVTCPVMAGFTASSLEIPIGQTISFTNTSSGSPVTNAWYINNVLTGISTNFASQFNQAGTFSIILTVGSGVCTSSKSITIDVLNPCNSTGYFEKLISLPTMGMIPKQTIVARDSCIIIVGGSISYYPNPYSQTMTIMKLSSHGNIIWSKNYYDPLIFIPDRVMQLNDGNFLVAGSKKTVATDTKLYIMKIDGNGQILWKKSFSKPGVNYAYCSAMDLAETTENEIIMSTTLINNSNSEGESFIFKFDAAGTLLWNKEVNNTLILNLAVKNSGLYASMISLYQGTYTQVYSNIVKIDIPSGALVFAKKYTSPPPGNNVYAKSLKNRNLRFINNELRVYGTITDGSGTSDTGYHFIARIDTFGVIQEAKSIRFTDPQLYITANYPSYFKYGIPLKNGEFALLEDGHAPTIPFSAKVFIQRTDLAGNNAGTNHVMRGLKMNFRSSQVSYSDNYNFAEGPANNLVIASVAYDSSQSKNGMLVFSSDNSGNVSNNCPPIPSTHTYYPNIVITNDAPEVTITNASFTTDPDFIILDSVISYNTNNICSEPNINNCFSVKIIIPDTLCFTQDSVLVSCHRNPGCNESINWNVSSPGQNAYRVINDSTIKIKFPFPGNYTIGASLNSCSNVNDTARLFIAKNAATLALGPDMTICNFSTSILNAGSGYKSYSWQNGSTDSTNTVYDPGTYYVTVQDYCNNIASDTVNFILAPPPVFDLGPDKVICNMDTLNITAPAGFSNYNWASNYSINTTSGQSVRIWPAIDTVYTATARYNDNCTVIDSIKISVKSAIPIFLGSDTSFCQGGSVSLVAGAGFSSYQWNTGATTSSISVSSTGMYFIAATNSSGCVSRDTLNIIEIFPNPIVNLGTDTSICRNTTLLLNAGSGFTNYNWQNNSHNQHFPANSAGTYWVTVTNNNGCTGTDSLTILRVLDTARNFIDPVIEICEHTLSQVKPGSAFNSYLWSTGSTKDSILINQPGNYWLQVINTSGCKAKESFTVINKKCMSGVYFPNAFTPNNDNKNDYFKALVYEDLDDFEMAVYNRYGQMVFTTKDYSTGWDGTFKGVVQDSGVFVWFCTYKLKQSDNKETRKGTVLLLR